MRSLVIISLLFAFLIPLPASDNPVYQYIEKEDISGLEQYLQENDINAVLEDNNTTLLIYAIGQRSHRVCQFLIEQGADVNQHVQGLSPLMHASFNSSTKIFRQLIDASANINARDSLNSTVLFYAASGGRIRICKILLKNGVPLNHQNNTWLTAYDYAVRGAQHEAAKFLRRYHEKHLPDMRDGPYVKWGRFDMIRAFYIVHDSVTQNTHKHDMKFRAETDLFMMDGFAGDSLYYFLQKSKDIPADQITGVDRILVIGDIHGGYDSLVNFLVNNGIINRDLQWTWGSGLSAYADQGREMGRA